MIQLLLIIFLAVSTPNIAIEQYESDLSDEEWEKELEKIKESSKNIANPEDSEYAKLVDLDKWTKFFNEPHEGKMFKSECNSIGECEYFWVDPPNLTYNVTSQYGEVRQISVYCDDGTFANYTTLDCELTEAQKKANQQTMIIIIALAIFIALSASFVYFKFKLKRGED